MKPVQIPRPYDTGYTLRKLSWRDVGLAWYDKCDSTLFPKDADVFVKRHGSTIEILHPVCNEWFTVQPEDIHIFYREGGPW